MSACSKCPKHVAAPRERLGEEQTPCPPAASELRGLAQHPTEGGARQLTGFCLQAPPFPQIWGGECAQAERARRSPSPSLAEQPVNVPMSPVGGHRCPPSSPPTGSLLPPANNRPRLGARRVPALPGRVLGGPGEPRGAEQKPPDRAHLRRSFCSRVPLLPSLASRSLAGKKKIKINNFAAPKINLTQAPAPGRGNGARGRAGGRGAHLPKKPSPLTKKERNRDFPQGHGQRG